LPLSAVANKKRRFPVDRWVTVLLASLGLISAVVLVYFAERPRPKAVAANFARVGGPTRVETALDAARYWSSPARVVSAEFEASPEAMLAAARCAARLNAPLLFHSPKNGEEEDQGRDGRLDGRSKRGTQTR